MHNWNENRELNGRYNSCFKIAPASKYCANFFSFKEKFMLFLLFLNIYDSGSLHNV